MKPVEAEQHLADMLSTFTAGSVLHLRTEAVRKAAAVGTLFTASVGMDAVWPGRR